MKWEEELKLSINAVDTLLRYTQLTPDERSSMESVCDLHPMRVTKYYLSLIDWSNPDDPIRKLAIPSPEELNLSGTYDTSGEADNTKLPGLQHKYNETALLLATNECGVFCRFCFRKRMVGVSNSETIKRFHDTLDYIRGTEQITNVLISGGDPFLLPNKVLREFLSKLVKIEHLKYIRFGTRVPVTFPNRILHDKLLINMLKNFDTKKKIHITTHFNHPNEITPQSTEAVKILGLPVNNQAVLLKGVNDNSDTLVELMNGLVSIGVAPYYVFQCRPTARVKEGFQLPIIKGLEIIEEARTRLDGYAKRFRYIMSVPTGKVEILGRDGDYFLFKYHQAKNPKDANRIFKKGIDLHACWLDEF